MTLSRTLLASALVSTLGCGASAAATRPTPAGAQAETLVGGGADGRTFEVANREFHLTAGADVEFPDGRDTAEAELGEGPWQVMQARASDVTGDGVPDAILELTSTEPTARALLIVDAANGRVQGLYTARELRVPDATRPERVRETRIERCTPESPTPPWTTAFRLSCCSCSQVCTWDELDPDAARDCQAQSSSFRYDFTPPGARVPLMRTDSDAAPDCGCD